MIERDSTQSVPLAPPHYELLSHPLVHHPSSNTYSDCQDILENAICLLELFHNLEFDENSNRGALSASASGAFYCLIIMLKDTLAYVSQNLDDAWREREAPQVETQLRQSAFFKAIQEATSANTISIHSSLASCLGVSCTDIEAFISLIEGQKNNDDT